MTDSRKESATIAKYGDAKAMFPVRIGRHVKPDGWHIGNALVASDWDRAAFRLPTNHYQPVQLAVNVEVTGKTTRRANGGIAVRVRITFVGDGEPDKTVGGWMWV